jgi:hypothetical protein
LRAALNADQVRLALTWEPLEVGKHQAPRRPTVACADAGGLPVIDSIKRSAEYAE